MVHATNCDRLGSEDGSRARGPTSLAVFAAHSAQATSSAGVCRRPDRLSHIELRCAGHARSAARAHQLPRASGGSARQWLQCASTGGSVPACASLSECRPAAPGAVGFVLKASFAVEVRSIWSRDHVRAGPGRWTAMDARHWSGLMCLETQGTRGGGPALVLDGMAEELTPKQLGKNSSEQGRRGCREDLRPPKEEEATGRTHSHRGDRRRESHLRQHGPAVANKKAMHQRSRRACTTCL